MALSVLRLQPSPPARAALQVASIAGRGHRRVPSGGTGGRPRCTSTFEAAVGGTDLLLLKGPSERTGCRILGKCEYQNPGGSVKDRAALWMVRDAVETGVLVVGEPGIVVEGTAGNTGIGLALAAQVSSGGVQLML